jgi:L-alanine-DL-glutamate epimerase-like enolase superfamily enzyme
MRITRIDDLHCDAGWRTLSFLKVATDTGLVGWSEYNESYGNKGLTAVIRGLADRIIGEDPRRVEAISSTLAAATRQVPGGVMQQAIGAIENALLDVKARALGVPVHEMLGGPTRERVPVYWSHCGSYRLSHAELIGVEPVRRLDDLFTLGSEVARRGFSALKTNIFDFSGPRPAMFQPGFAWSPGFPELNLARATVAALVDQLAALRSGAGPNVEIFVDLNFNFKTEGFLGIVRALAESDIDWIELDSYDPDALALIRRTSTIPIASCESLFGRRQYRPFFEKGAVDVAIVDVPWNGLLEALKIAAMAEAYEINVAPHNFYGPLSSLMSAAMCALVPNLRLMEIDVDDVPWRDELITEPPVIEEGHFIVPTTPGWGADVNEDVVRAHPPATRSS